ncbi:MAG: helix-turn-helix domain-containing protein [Candidatus Brocadiales bacterium]
MEIVKNGLLDMEEAALYLNIKKSTLYQMSMRHQIPVVKIGRLNRFRKVDLDAFINSNIVEKNEG